MTRALRRGVGPLLLGSALRLGPASIPTASAEELRIGYLAPTTGIFAQVGKDMVDGFKMYLDEHKNNFGGAKVKLIVEDTVGKPDTAVTKAKKLILQDKVHMVIGGLARLGGLRAGAGQHRRQDRLHLVGRGGRRSDPTPARQVPVFHPHRLDAVRSRAIRSANGLASRATRRSSRSAPTMRSATR